MLRGKSGLRMHRTLSLGLIEVWQQAVQAPRQLLWWGYMLVIGVVVMAVAWPGLSLFSALLVIVILSLLGWAARAWPAMQLSVLLTGALAWMSRLTGMVSLFESSALVLMGAALVLSFGISLVAEYGNTRLTARHAGFFSWAAIVAGAWAGLLHWVAKPASGFYFANLPFTAPAEVLLLAVVAMVFLHLLMLRAQSPVFGDWLGLFPPLMFGLYVLWLHFGRADTSAALPVATLEHSLLLLHVPAMIVAFALLINVASSGLWYLLSGTTWFRRHHNRDVLETRLVWFSDYLYRRMALAMVFLTTGVLTGLHWSDVAWGHYWFGEIKQVLTIALWLSLLAGLHWRLQKGMQQRVFAWWCVGVSLLAGIVWIGTNLHPQGLHSFGSL